MTDAPNRIIFLDVDGPIINTPCYFINHMASMERRVLNTQAIGYVIDVAKQANALVVMNTTHNTFDIEDEITGKMRTVKDDMIYWGMPEELFHSDWKTEYPNPIGAKMSENRRLFAVKKWLAKNGPYDWIAFDDEYFTSDPNLILINFDWGVDHEAHKKSSETV